LVFLLVLGLRYASVLRMISLFYQTYQPACFGGLGFSCLYLSDFLVAFF